MIHVINPLGKIQFNNQLEAFGYSVKDIVETSRKVMVDVLQGGRTPRRLVMDLSGAKKLGRDAKSKGGAK